MSAAASGAPAVDVDAGDIGGRGSLSLRELRVWAIIALLWFRGPDYVGVIGGGETTPPVPAVPTEQAVQIAEILKDVKAIREQQAVLVAQDEESRRRIEANQRRIHGLDLLIAQMSGEPEVQEALRRSLDDLRRMLDETP